MSKLSETIKKDEIKSTPLGKNIWLCAIVFGLVGQIAWAVENLTFAKFAQDIFSNSGRSDMSYIVTTLMVWFSAIAATVTTIFAGGFVDKLGKRKPFIAYGYIIWGVTIMLFATIPMTATTKTIGLIAALLVIFDCIMTFFGSTANDAAFNTWVTDVTDSTNRGKVNTLLSVSVIIAFVLVFVLQMLLYNENATDSNWLFFVVIGIIPIIAGIIAIFTLKDSPNIVKNCNPDYLKETFYGFRPSVIKENKMLYICLTTSCLIGISQQTFFSYLMNFIMYTLGITDFLLPLAIVIVGAGALTGVMGVLFDKFGRKHFYMPILALIVFGTLVIYLLKFMNTGAYLPVLIVGGIIMLGAILACSGALMSSFQDYIPKGCEGRFQGVRMCFTVMIPMIIGPLITLIIGLNNTDTSAAGFAPPYEIFLAASVIAVLAFIPMFFVRKDATRLREAKTAEKALEETLLGEPLPSNTLEANNENVEDIN